MKHRIPAAIILSAAATIGAAPANAAPVVQGALTYQYDDRHYDVWLTVKGARTVSVQLTGSDSSARRTPSGAAGGRLSRRRSG